MPDLRDPLPSATHRPAATALAAQVDARLGQLLPPAQDDAVAAAMRAAVLAPGKRLRPLLTLLAGQALGCSSPALLEAACAVEMVHAASLVMDDLPCMDDAPLRRGLPAVHVRFGEDVAMLAAIGLLMQAQETLLQAPSVDDGQRCRLALVLSRAVGPAGLVRGQFKDLREGALLRSVPAVAEANLLKTGVLFAAALEMAAVVARRPDAVDPLRDAAAEVGQAFQLRDDLDDGDPAGGALPEDAGKSTMVALLGRRATEQRLRDHVERAAARLRLLLGPDSVLEQLVHCTFPGLPPEAAAAAGHGSAHAPGPATPAATRARSRTASQAGTQPL